MSGAGEALESSALQGTRVDASVPAPAADADAADAVDANHTVGLGHSDVEMTEAEASQLLGGELQSLKKTTDALEPQAEEHADAQHGPAGTLATDAPRSSIREQKEAALSSAMAAAGAGSPTVRPELVSMASAVQAAASNSTTTPCEEVDAQDRKREREESETRQSAVVTSAAHNQLPVQTTDSGIADAAAPGSAKRQKLESSDGEVKFLFACLARACLLARGHASQLSWC